MKHAVLFKYLDTRTTRSETQIPTRTGSSYNNYGSRAALYARSLLPNVSHVAPLSTDIQSDPN